MKTIIERISWAYFSFDGRITRSTWWQWQLPLWLGYALWFGLWYWVGRSDLNPDLGIAILLVPLVPLNWAFCGICAKHWHDRNKSAWWNIVGCSGIGIIWVPVELGCLRGDAVPNDYGPAPIGSSGGISSSGTVRR